MPVIKSAIKKARRDKKRTKINEEFSQKLKNTIRLARKSKKSDSIKDAVSIIDKAVKKNIIHKNKGARLKSSLSKLVKLASQKAKSPVKVVKRASSK